MLILQSHKTHSENKENILDKIKKKEKRDRQKSDKIKLPHKYKSERKPISHE